MRILSVVPDEVPDTGAAAKRQAANQEAVERSEAIDIARLALTVDAKWGSCDPDALVPGDEDPPAPPGRHRDSYLWEQKRAIRFRRHFEEVNPEKEI